MHNMIHRSAVCTGALLALLLSGCARSESTRFYVLSSLPAPESTSQEQSLGAQLVVGIGPVVFPEYLDRPQIVSRASGNRLILAEFDRWAEPLEQSFARTLAENLSGLLSTERVVLLPWKGGGPVDYRITMEVLRFDCASDGSVSLIARWTLFGSDGNELAPPRRSRIAVSTQLPHYEGVAAAMSEAVRTLSDEIVAEIKGRR